MTNPSTPAPNTPPASAPGSTSGATPPPPEGDSDARPIPAAASGPTMNLLTWNVLMALIWAATTEEFSAPNLATGFVLGYIVLFVLRTVVQQQKYFRDAYEIIALGGFFVVELVLANFRMAYYTVMPLNRMRPAVIAVPIEPMNDTEITVFANLLTLTPGTLALDVSEDRRIMYVHVMRVYDLEEAKREIKRGFEDRVIKGLR